MLWGVLQLWGGKKNDLLEFIKKEDSKKDSIGILLISHQNETRQSNSNTATWQFEGKYWIALRFGDTG